MANSPPTPPPTSATELEDQARAQAPAATAPASAVPAPAIPAPSPKTTQARQATPDVYQYISPKLANLAAKNDYRVLVRVAEDTDLNVESERQPSRLLVIAPLVLSYLILDELPPARQALIRLPDNLAVLPLAQALFNLLASTWERKYARVYSRAEDLFQLVGQADFPEPKLGSVLLDMITTFLESFRQRTFTLLSKAYTTIALSMAQSYLGLPADQLLSVAVSNGWSHDASMQILSPVPLKPSSEVQVTSTAPSSLDTFELVADSVIKQEF